MFAINLSSLPIYPIIFVLAVFCGLFLFWRAGRHELVESDLLFDVTIVSLAGSLLFGRIFDFVIRPELYDWSAKRFIFVNFWGGFDFYGALVGAILASAVYLLGRKISVWSIVDLAAAPTAFAQSLIAFGRFLASNNRLALFYFVGYFLIFWALKRLEAKKRHRGFFGSFYLVSFSTLNLLLFGFKQTFIKLGGLVPYDLAAAGLILFLAGLAWYSLTGRNPKDDIKSLFALVLLGIFKIKRTLTSPGEADEIARLIILLPYYVLRIFYFLVRTLWREVTGSIGDFWKALGFRK